MEQYLNIDSFLIFTLGFGIFLLSMLGDWLSPTKELKPFKQYCQDFLYTIISIIIGIAACVAIETSPSITYLVSILMGFIGASLIKKLKDKKEAIADGIIDSVEHKIEHTIEKTETSTSTTVKKNKVTFDYINEKIGTTSQETIADDKSA